MCNHAVTKLAFAIRYVSHWYKTHQICDKAILENDVMLESVPDCYKNQQMCDKVVDNYLHALKFFTWLQYNSKNVWWSCQYSSFYNLFLIGTKLKKCVTELFLKVLLW